MAVVNALENHVAIVTGATKGIGFAIARMLGAQGVKLVLNARTLSALEETRAKLVAQQPKSQIEIVAGSMSEPDTAQKLVETALNRFGALNIVINNAGVAPHFALVQELSLEELNETIDVNLKGPLFLMKYAMEPLVQQGGGFIININSVAGKTPFPYSAVYCASKFGLTALTECVAAEQRPNKVKVVGIYPGEVYTPIWDRIEPHVKQNPEQMLAAEDVAEAVRYILHQSPNAIVKDVTLVPANPPVH